MSVLNDGRFVFTDKKGNIYLESKTANDCFNLLYGSRTLAHAFNEEISLVALVCPLIDAALESSPTNDDPSRSVLKVYRFDDDNLTELLDEVETPLALSVLWVNPGYLVVSNPDNVTSVVKFSKDKLKVVVRDKCLYPFVSHNLLGLLPADSSLAYLWDVDRDKKVDTITLQNTRKRGKKKTIRGSCCSGNFAVLAYEDGTASVLYILGNSARLLSPSPLISFSHSIPMKNSQSESEASAKNLCIHPLCTALSSSTIVVGVCGGTEIFKLNYKSGNLKVESHNKLDQGEELAAISKKRCLVRKMDKNNEKTITFTTYPLSTIGSPKVEVDQVGSVDTDLNESTKKKRRRRSKREKSILEVQTPDDLNKNIAGANYLVYGTGATISMLFVGVLITFYMRRR
ncbi:unnamed protein product [Phytomonas sp. Hart1]|nr:unnamed protein product [Phytomonas sp. Hart1]|eukprot:CCW71491.1 unnamed protein product [Phytomonas sp. isolate Hart1]